MKNLNEMNYSEKNKNLCLVNVAHWLQEYLPATGMETAAIILSILALLLSEEKLNIWQWILIISAIILFILTFIAIYDKEKHKPNIESELEKTRIELKKAGDEVKRQQEDILEADKNKYNLLNEILERQLIALSKELDYCHEERITVYHYKDNQFNKVQRYSKNAKYNEGGRPSYPNEGVIGKAWEEGDYFISDIPEHSTTNTDNYYTQQKEKGFIERQVAEKLTMKSRSYFGQRLDNESETENIAIIIFESTNPKKINKEEIEKKVSKQLIGIITLILKELKKPKEDYTKEGDIIDGEIEGINCSSNR